MPTRSLEPMDRTGGVARPGGAAGVLFLAGALVAAGPGDAPGAGGPDPTAETCLAAGLHPEQLRACALVCDDEAGVGWCPAFCAGHPDAPCLDAYRRPAPVERAFEGAWSLAAAAGFEGRWGSGGAAAFVGEVRFGRRTHPGLLVEAAARLGVGADDRPHVILPIALELGLEHLLAAPGALVGLGARAGVWWPDVVCGGGASGCPTALLVGLAARHRWPLGGVDPRHDPFVGPSIGLGIAAGYDPDRSLWLGRVTLDVGLDLLFR